MEKFSKTVKVQGTSSEHTITVTAGDGIVKIHCDCEAGIHRRLCKHIIEYANSDIDLQPYLMGANLGTAFENYYYTKKEIDRLQSETRRLKNKIEKAIF